MKPDDTGPRDRVVDGVSVAFLTAAALLSGLLEVTFLSQWYVGTVIIPVMILAAIAGNIALPWWGYRILQRPLGSVLPVLAWLLPVLALTMYDRPEGDLFVLGAYGEDTAFYALLLVGAAGGFATVVLTAGRPQRR